MKRITFLNYLPAIACFHVDSKNDALDSYEKSANNFSATATDELSKCKTSIQSSDVLKLSALVDVMFGPLVLISGHLQASRERKKRIRKGYK